jgi:hypothetical protein
MKKETLPPPVSADYTALLDLLNNYSHCCVALDELQSRANVAALEFMKPNQADYSDLQVAVTDLEAAAELLARKHPEWFADTKTLKTPFGQVKFVASNILEVSNEDMAIVLIERAAESDESLKLAITTSKSLNLKLLALLDDAELGRFRIKRVPKENFSISPARVELGKAVSSAAQASANEALPV